ncbi:MAG: ATP synthase F0 subunit B [Candidatus Aminicenantales bacterium]
MSSKKQGLWILLMVPLFIFMTSSASAEEGSDYNLKDFLGKVINFIILFGGLTYILYKPLRNFLEKRTADVGQSIRESETLRTEAEKKLQEARQRLADLEKEIHGLRKAAEAEGIREKARIQSITEKEMERIRQLTREEIERQARAGIRELREFTADLAVTLAEARIKEKASPREHTLLIDKSIERLAELYEKSNSG